MRAEYQHYEAELRRLIEGEKLTQKDVARRLQKDETTIQRWCARFGLATQRTGPRSGSGHPNWQGGRRQVGRYWSLSMPEHPLATKNGLVLEHRLIVEARLGRYLTRDEVVHHIDGNPENNDPTNLAPFATNADHLRHELTGRIPKWSEAGKLAIAQLLARNAAIRRRSRLGANGRFQPIDRQPS